MEEAENCRPHLVPVVNEGIVNGFCIYSTRKQNIAAHPKSANDYFEGIYGIQSTVIQNSNYAVSDLSHITLTDTVRCVAVPMKWRV